MSEHRTHSKRKLTLWLLAFASVVMAFAFQGSRGLWDSDEGRYTAVTLNMMDSGDYLLPRRNDDAIHVTKPPVTYWAIAASAHLFGKNEWAFRFPMAVCFALSVFFVYRLGESFVPKRPWLPAFIYLCSPLPVLAANVITTDTILACAETAAVLAYVNCRFGNKSLRWLDLMWALFGLAFMVKGPPGLLPLLAIMLWEWQHGNIKSIFRLKGLLFFIGIGLTWFFIIVYKKPELLNYFLSHEVIDRVASPVHGRNSQWYGGLKIYLPTLFFGAMPWLALAMWNHWTVNKDKARSPDTKFLWYWLSFPLIVFIFSSSRLPFYVLPLFVPIALLLAQQFETTPLKKYQLSGFALLFIALIGGKAFISHVSSDQDARTLAADIKRVLPYAASELIFVETNARYGLRFYLDAEVEKVSLSQLSSNKATLTSEYDDNLFNEISEDETGAFYLMPFSLEPEFSKQVGLQNHKAQLVGKTEKLAIYRITR